MSSNRTAVLSTVLTAPEAFAWIVETTLTPEVEYTAEHNETRSLADYVADLHRTLGRILDGEGYDELTPAPVDILHVPYGEGDVNITDSDGSDGARLIVIDTIGEPDGSDGTRPIRVLVNDHPVYEGVAYSPKADGE